MALKVIDTANHSFSLGAVETPIYIYFKIQPRGLTSSDWYLSGYDLIITVDVRGRN